MDNAFFDYISSSALSLVVSGNTGISPFLTLFVLGLTEMVNPELLNMGATMEIVLASWWSIGILGLLTLGETVGKCIPAIDEIIDSAEVFVVPAISVLASLATMGLLPVPGGSDADAGQGQSIDVLGLLGGGSDGGDYRLLQGDNSTIVDEFDAADDGGNDFGEGFMTFTKVILVILGVGISLLIHFFKMLLRVSSMMCSGGCCQPCITVSEFALVIFGVLFSIVAPIFAIIACIAMLIAAGYVIRVKFCKKKNDADDEDDNKSKIGSNKKKRRSTSSSNSTGSDDDIEKQEGSPSIKADKRNTSITTPVSSPSESFAEGEFVSTLPPALAPADNKRNNKLEMEATTY